MWTKIICFSLVSTCNNLRKHTLQNSSEICGDYSPQGSGRNWVEIRSISLTTDTPQEMPQGSTELALEGSWLTEGADWVCMGSRSAMRQEEHPLRSICEPLCWHSFTAVWKPGGFSALPRTKRHLKHPQDLWFGNEPYLWFQRVVLHQHCWANALLLPEKAEMSLWGPECHMWGCLLPQ